MTKEKRAEALMAKGPIQNVRRIMELEDALGRTLGEAERLDEQNHWDRGTGSYEADPVLVESRYVLARGAS